MTPATKIEYKNRPKEISKFCCIFRNFVPWKMSPKNHSRDYRPKQKPNCISRYITSFYPKTISGYYTFQLDNAALYNARSKMSE